MRQPNSGYPMGADEHDRDTPGTNLKTAEDAIPLSEGASRGNAPSGL